MSSPVSSEMLPNPTTLRPCKRHVATHDDQGKSIYTTSPAQAYHAVPNVGGMARSYAVDSVPANLSNGADLKAYLSKDGITSYTQRDIVVPSDTGANLVVVDIAPGGFSQMHRTVSIDFSICVIGEIEHELDSGEKVKLLPGVSTVSAFQFRQSLTGKFVQTYGADHRDRIILFNVAQIIDGSMHQRPNLLDLLQSLCHVFLLILLGKL